MYEDLIRLITLAGFITFGLRAVLADLGLPGWALIFSVIVAVGVIYGIRHIPHVTRTKEIWPQPFPMP